MSDHYPSINTDLKFKNKYDISFKLSDEKKAFKKNKQHERIAKVNEIIKKYANPDM